MPLSDVSILLTAGSRPGYLNFAILGIRRNLPECKIIVVNDDGRSPVLPQEFQQNVIWKEMPRDTWLTRKRNAGVALSDTKYTLLAADDFKFDIDTRSAVIRMAEILDIYRAPDVVAGTFNDRRYEGKLEVIPGEYIREHQLDETTETPFMKSAAYTLWQVDIAANFFLARTPFLRHVKWDESIGPIGGEHADWFLDAKAAHGIIVWTPGLNIYEQEKDRDMEDPGYGAMRKRVWDGHALMLKKRRVKRYIGFGDKP